MKKLLQLLVSLLLLLTTLTAIQNLLNPVDKNKPITEQTPIDNNRYTVVLDAGHGGYDNGSIATDGTLEKNINLEITTMIGTILENNGIQVIYIRKDDITDFANEDNLTDLNYRANIANQTNADVFLSIHCNASELGDSYGFETWTKTEDPTSYQLATHINENLEGLNYTQNRGIMDGSNSLHLITSTLPPAVLIEIGFIDNNTDYSYISTPSGKQAIAKAISDAIINEKTIYEENLNK